MATPPSFIQEAESAYNSATTPKSTAAFNCLADDLLVGFAGSADSPAVLDLTAVDALGNPIGWTLMAPIKEVGRAWAGMWWTRTVADHTALTPSIASASSFWFGGNVTTWRSTRGIGAYAKVNAVDSAPSLNLTTRYDNSAIVILCVDWDANSGASRAWRTGAGALTELTYFAGGGTTYTIYGGYHADAGVAGLKTVGLTTPIQQYSLTALEVYSGDLLPPILTTKKAW
jgi:hypothetical protein